MTNGSNGILDLVIDIGNSRTKLALFRGRTLIDDTTLDQLSVDAVKRFLDDRQVGRVAVASVAADPRDVLRVFEGYGRVLAIGPDTPIPIRSSYASMATLGMDRLANAVAGHVAHPGRNVLIIDIGSCITYDLVVADGTFLGGAISPGIRMRARAMNEHSARLPLVDTQNETQLIGNDTTSSLRSGAIQGTQAELQGMIQAFGKDHRDLVVVLTGGDAERFTGALKNGIFADPFLTLRGIHAILQHQEKSADPPVR